MNKSCIKGIGICAGVAGAFLVVPTAQADTNIPENIAQKEIIPINIIPGQTTAINFENDDRVSYLILSDRSKIIYSLNAPTDSGQAKSIFLRNIKPLDFPGEITSNQPNLFVVAIDDRGRQEQYEFIVDNSQKHDTKINITPEKKEAPKKPINVINTELGAATPADVRIGLKYKLRKAEISPNDPIALYTSEAIALTLNSQKNLLALAEELDIPLSVLSEFGRTGLAQKAKFRIQKANRKKANALKAARQSLIEEQSEKFVIDTDLGKANLEDIKFGLSVMQKRETITEQKAQRISKIIKQAMNEKRKFSARDKEELSNVGRLGLAFSSRLRILGTLD
ncbi:hypothetical protein I4641_02480 [Waterburya agarophytonicola K14]|uniref:DUF4384 domain-containing protein n=1 Tax=Waterburya agarophytonicola KI4 TaxID=2874699 RepID=A0A964BLY6_9CYAN|nr:hypothetical protein [Waterburya agarophytonicola]MCC0175848.1 hypothetical protein [Waterburya agarophytonicola KI4]